MAQVEMIAPEGLSGVSIEGFKIDVVDGRVLVDEARAHSLVSHGFRMANPVGVDGGRQAGVATIANPARIVAESLSDEALRNFAALSEDDRRQFWKQFSDEIDNYPEYIERKKVEEAAEADAKKVADAAAAAEADAKKVADAAAAAAAAKVAQTK